MKEATERMTHLRDNRTPDIPEESRCDKWEWEGGKMLLEQKNQGETSLILQMKLEKP